MATVLTPTTIMDLRLSCPTLCHLGGGVNMGVPYILYLPAEDTFCLHAYGSPQAKHADPRVLGECLRQERAEPGFIRRVLGTEQDVETASLDPAGALMAQRQRNAERATAAQALREADAASRRRAASLDVSRLSLDDLL